MRGRRPDATLILLLPPSLEAQEARLRARGDDESAIARASAHRVPRRSAWAGTSPMPWWSMAR